MQQHEMSFKSAVLMAANAHEPTIRIMGPGIDVDLTSSEEEQYEAKTHDESDEEKALLEVYQSFPIISASGKKATAIGKATMKMSNYLKPFDTGEILTDKFLQGDLKGGMQALTQSANNWDFEFVKFKFEDGTKLTIYDKHKHSNKKLGHISEVKDNEAIEVDILAQDETDTENQFEEGKEDAEILDVEVVEEEEKKGK